MLKKIGFLIAYMSAFPVVALAQTVTNTGGISGNIPVFTGSATVGLSTISQAGGNVGIGSTSPSTTLQVASGGNVFGAGGSFGISANSGVPPMFTIQGSLLENGPSGDFGSVLFNIRSLDTFALVPSMALASNGNIGIGTTTPSTTLQVVSGGNTAGAGGSIGISANGGAAPIFSIQGSLYNNGISGDSGDVLFNVRNSGASALITSMTLTHNGNVGVGTTSLGEKLEVSGNIKLIGSGSSIVFPGDGGTQTVARTGSLTGGDYAESVDVTGDRDDYEPGDVLVVDHKHPGHFLKLTKRYSLAITGVYSTKPGVVGRRQKIAKALTTSEVPMAMVGIVPIKVTSENGPIEPGGVLVTSSRAGYAMKGMDRSLLAGTVIGKALEPLNSDTGVIEAVISLQ